MLLQSLSSSIYLSVLQLTYRFRTIKIMDILLHPIVWCIKAALLVMQVPCILNHPYSLKEYQLELPSTSHIMNTNCTNKEAIIIPTIVRSWLWLLTYGIQSSFGAAIESSEKCQTSSALRSVPARIPKTESMLNLDRLQKRFGRRMSH